MRRISLIFILFLMVLVSKATHIVGGEFELIHLVDYQYRLNMILYFDHIYGDPLAEDNIVTAYIYRKKDDAFMETVLIRQIRDTFVPYSNIECTIDELVTRRIEYTGTVTLSPEDYNDPGGYYVIWERCCRNHVITNIADPGDTGQSFYLEFPPVVRDGEQFVNSSPVLFKPLRDYACVDQFYWADFTGHDADGDSLVYSLATPLGLTRPNTVVALPQPAGPYTGSTVIWTNPHRMDNQIPGNPALQIDSSGLLTVNPSTPGLFVFSIKVEEFRDGRKIGEIRRDFQMLVIDCPPTGTKPEISVLFPEKERYYQEGEPMSFTLEDEKCIKFYVKDLNENEKVRFSLNPVNFPVDLSDALSVTEATLTSPDDSVEVDFCLPNCPYPETFYLDIIAGDNTCPLPLQDTMRMALNIEPLEKHSPYFTNPEDTFRITLREGESWHLDIEGVDDDQDSVQLDLIAGFDLTKAGMAFQELSNQDGRVLASFDWDTRCNVYDFTKQTTFDLQLKLSDLDICNSSEPDVIRLQLEVILPGNDDPVISTDLSERQFEMQIGEVLDFSVFGKDIDGDSLQLTIQSPVSHTYYQMDFENVNGRGEVEASFYWNPTCEDQYIRFKDNYRLRFVLNDLDKCKFPNYDTLEVNIKLVPPDNRPPVLEMWDNIKDAPVDIENFDLTVKDSVSLSIIGRDEANDSIWVSLAGVHGPVEDHSFNFLPAGGAGFASALFTWRPDCGDLVAGSELTEYQFVFNVTDYRCFNPADTAGTLFLNLSDMDFDDNFLPPNVFSPNGDGINDLFFIEDLPLDNCTHEFERITIFNRWGKRVFEDVSRDFTWMGNEVGAGVYFYQLEYTGRVFNGSIHLLR